MKLNNIIFPMLAGSLMLVGCYDEKMDWHTPEGHNPVTTDDIPLTLQEKIAQYDYIKNYMAEYMPNTVIGLGLGADKYLDDEDPAYAETCDENFQQYVTGNAMKMDAIVQGNGSLNFSKVDAFLAKVPADMQVFGHNFIWHTQQQQAYLRSLIAPTQSQIIIGGIATILLGDNWNFNGGTQGDWGISCDSEKAELSVEADGGQDGSDCMKVVNHIDGNAYEAQVFYDLLGTLDMNKTYKLTFKAKADVTGGYIQCQTQSVPSYGSQQWGTEVKDLDTEWREIEWEFTPQYDDDNRVIFNLGKVAGTYYIDDVVFGEKLYDDSSHDILPGSGKNYTLKTPKEKRTALLGAMENWIKGMLEHVKSDTRFVGWDVINEPVSHNGGFRGIDGDFDGTYEDNDGNTLYDGVPVENEETGLTLNWGGGHFYWGYYLGMDYAVKAFEFARWYAAPNIKLFVNDYGLEGNPNKLNKLIEFVKYIDEHNSANTPLVDGIATQMHVTASAVTREDVDEMFKTMAATGKLVRVSELDVALGSASPSAEQLQLQSDVYQMIMESYKENVPEAQQAGFVIWTLSDAADEHENWIPNDAPNLFDANYERKLAYKGLCDGIAGQDLGADMKGEMWKDNYPVEDEEETLE